MPTLGRASGTWVPVAAGCGCNGLPALGFQEETFRKSGRTASGILLLSQVCALLRRSHRALILAVLAGLGSVLTRTSSLQPITPLPPRQRNVCGYMPALDSVQPALNRCTEADVVGAALAIADIA